MRERSFFKIYSVILSEKLPVKREAHSACQKLRDRIRQPEPVQPETREQIAERDEQHDRPDDREYRAFQAGPHRLKEHRENQRRDHRQKAGADNAESERSDVDYKRVGREYAKHLRLPALPRRPSRGRSWRRSS